jgi:hypothetical protein
MRTRHWGQGVVLMPEGAALRIMPATLRVVALGCCRHASRPRLAGCDAVHQRVRRRCGAPVLAATGYNSAVPSHAVAGEALTPERHATVGRLTKQLASTSVSSPSSHFQSTPADPSSGKKWADPMAKAKAKPDPTKVVSASGPGWPLRPPPRV